jgi:hypothetical protein
MRCVLFGVICFAATTAFAGHGTVEHEKRIAAPIERVIEVIQEQHGKLLLEAGADAIENLVVDVPVVEGEESAGLAVTLDGFDYRLVQYKLARPAGTTFRCVLLEPVGPLKAYNITAVLRAAEEGTLVTVKVSATYEHVDSRSLQFTLRAEVAKGLRRIQRLAETQ